MVVLAKSRRPRVLALVGEYKGPTIWRVFWPYTRLEQQGWATWWCDKDDPKAGEAAVYADAVSVPRIHWHRVDLPGAYRWVDALHRLGKAVLFDTDDDVFTDACLPHILEMGHQDGKADAQILEDRAGRIASLPLYDGITCTTQRLATTLRTFTDKPVVVVPNLIDWEAWHRLTDPIRREDDRLTIGWAGGRRLDADCAAMAVAWARVAARHPDVAFKLGGFHAPALVAAVPDGQRVLAEWQPLQTYPLCYTHVDIGCCPLADVPFNRTKSPIKAYEWAAAGAAVVASPTVYGLELRDGQTALLAETADDWEAALERLLADARLRRRLARRWAGQVQAHHSITAGVGRWVDAWERILGAFRARAAPLVLAR